MNEWTPISSGLLPEEMTDVQITFIGYVDHKPHCEAFAYMSEGKWYWSIDEEEVAVKITAWKEMCFPYQGE